MNTTVEGVVAESPSGVGQGPDCDLRLTLCAWRHEGDPALAVDTLELVIPVNQRTLRTEMRRLDAGVVVRVAVSALGPGVRAGSSRARGATPIKVLADARIDPALRAARDGWLAPVVLEDPYLGRMTLDRRIDAFVGKRRRGAYPYSLSVSLPGPHRDEETSRRHLERAHLVVARIEQGQAAILWAVAKELLALHNDTWRDVEAGEPRLDEAGFIARIGVGSIAVQPTGAAQVFVLDGGLFGEHFIIVDLDDAGRVARVSLGG